MLDTAQRRNLRFVGVLLGLGLLLAGVLWVVWQMRSIWPPFFVAFVLAIALAPLVDRLEARRWPRWLATTVVYFGVVLLIITLLFVFVPIVTGQISQIVADMKERFRLDDPVKVTRTMAEQIRIFGRQNEIPSFILNPIVRQAKNSATLLTQGLEQFAALLPGMLSSLIWVVLVPIIAFYALIDYHRIFAKTLLLTPRQSRDNMRSIADDVTVVFGKYLRGLGLICILDGLATVLVLWCFVPTRPYAAALGLIAGILYAVPYIGAIGSTGLIALVALASPDDGSFAMMIYVTAAMVGLHQVFFDQVLAPRLLGGHVGLHPILSILALMGGGVLFGVGGMLLAVPVAASIQVVILHIVPRLGKKIEVKMQEGPPETKPLPPDGPPITVSAGEGVVGNPQAAADTAPGPSHAT